MAKSGGRPTKYKPEYCDALIEHMAAGFSYETFAVSLPDGQIVNLDTLYNWESLFPAFSEAKTVAMLKNKMFWEQIGKEGMTGKIPGFNVTAWIFNMKNRHGWRDKKDIDMTQKTDISLHPEIVKLINEAKS